MEEALELGNYLPLSFKTDSERDYIRFLWDAFDSNYDDGKYQFAFLAYHMLTMSFVYFNIWQIKQTVPEDFAKAMVGFNKDVERELTEATSPFTFWRVNESAVMRFLKLIGCDNGKVGTYAALVKERNDTAHTNGNIFFKSQEAIDAKIREILRVVDEIQEHSVSTIRRCYAGFLQENSEADEWEYPESVDQVRELLIHAHYFSQKDIEVCLSFDISKLGIKSRADGVQELHRALRENFSAVV